MYTPDVEQQRAVHDELAGHRQVQRDVSRRQRGAAPDVAEQGGARGEHHADTEQHAGVERRGGGQLVPPAGEVPHGQAEPGEQPATKPPPRPPSPWKSR